MMTEISKWKAGCGGSRTSGLGEGVRKHVRCTGAVRRTPILHFAQIEAFFGPNKKLSAILIPHVSGFLKSDALLKMRSDRDRSEITVRKTVRVFRMFLVWAKERGYIAKLPLPKDVPLGRNANTQPEVGNAEPDSTAAAG